MNLSPSAHTDTFTRDNLPAVSLWPTIEFSIPEVQYPEFLNAATVLIDNAVEKFGADAPCLLTPDGVSWTYGTLLTKSNQIAQVLSEDLGLVAGNRVLLRGPNNPWLVACWLGVLKAGGVVVTTMHALRAAEIADVISLTQPSIAISDHRFVDELLKASVGNITTVSYGSDAKDNNALSPGHSRQRRHLCALHPEARSGRCLRRFTSTGVHLRSGRFGCLSAPLRGFSIADRTDYTRRTG